MSIWFRYSAIAIADAFDHLKRLHDVERFRDALKDAGMFDEFTDRYRSLRKTYKRWDTVRDTLAAHLDGDAVARGLDAAADQQGRCWIGESLVDFSFDVGHVVVAAAIAADENAVPDAHPIATLNEHIKRRPPRRTTCFGLLRVS